MVKSRQKIGDRLQTISNYTIHAGRRPGGKRQNPHRKADAQRGKARAPKAASSVASCIIGLALQQPKRHEIPVIDYPDEIILTPATAALMLVLVESSSLQAFLPPRTLSLLVDGEILIA